MDHLDVLLVADCPGRPASDVVRRLNAVSPEWSGLAGEYLGRATMLLRAEDVEEAARALHQGLRRALGAPLLLVADRVTGRNAPAPSRWPSGAWR